MLSWFTTRVFMFPVFVIYSTLFESVVSGGRPCLGVPVEKSSFAAPGTLSLEAARPLCLGLHPRLVQERAQLLGVADSIQPHHSILNGFLIFLYCLHVYW